MPNHDNGFRNQINHSEPKKQKLYVVTSKVVNLIAIFVACISVSTFFATKYIVISETFFSANILSTMISLAIMIVILEIYGKKNSIKAFMAGAYAILLVFFVSVFIPDFNPQPVGHYESSFINFHQKILLCVFISYIVSFLLAIKVYTFMKHEIGINIILVNTAATIVASQLVYTVIYHFIYVDLVDLNVLLYEIQNELYFKGLLSIVVLLLVYFIVSGIKSGMFDIAKHFTNNRSHHNKYDKHLKYAQAANKLEEIPSYPLRLSPEKHMSKVDIRHHDKYEHHPKSHYLDNAYDDREDLRIDNRSYDDKIDRRVDNRRYDDRHDRKNQSYQRYLDLPKRDKRFDDNDRFNEPSGRAVVEYNNDHFEATRIPDTNLGYQTRRKRRTRR